MSASQEILIAGGGMVGLSLALLLDDALPANVAITLVEGVTLPEATGDAAPYHPSFDARSTALSYSTARIYRSLGLWPSLEAGLGAIETIHVSRRGRLGSTCLRADEQGWEALGWVVENPCLGRALLSAVRGRSRLRLRCPAKVVQARAAAGGMSVEVVESGRDAETLDCDLLLIADGADSALREQLAFPTRRKSYAQEALVANVAFEGPHWGCAYERFTASGPLALLPLPATAEAASRMALVWTLAPEDAERLEHADDEAFAAALIDAFGQRLGRVRRVGRRARYPLVLTEALEQARRGCVVLGNAAHALHPVAGQGFNLALRDAAELVRVLAVAAKRGEPLGATETLASYAAGRARDQGQTIAASDGLPALFMQSDPLVSLVRDLALTGLDLIPALRREFVQQAAGMAALEAGHA